MTYDKSSQLNNQYKLYELIDMNRGGIYHDFTHGVENRRAWWGYQPYYPPNDEPGFVNEEFVRFVESRDDYLIRRPIFHIATLAEEFNNAAKNLSEYINKSSDKFKFYRNLRNLQEYLKECGYLKEDIILQEKKIELTPSKKSNLSQDEANRLAKDIANRLNLDIPKYLDSGEHGYAYNVGNETVMKLTTDKSEAVEAMKVRGKDLKHIADVQKIYSVKLKDGAEIFVILQEMLKTSPEINQELKKKIDRLRYIFENIFNVDLEDVLDFHGDYQYEKLKDKIDSYMEKNPEDAKFFNQLVEIRNDLKNIGSISIEFMNPGNLGYKKDGTLAFFDMGFGEFDFNKEKPEELKISEDGSTKFSTDSNVGGNQFPAYNQKSSEPVIDNNRDANSFLYHDNSFFTYENKELSEEFLGNYGIRGVKEHYEVFKNPKSIKRLKPEIRGIVTENGDLYVIDDNEEVIHNELATWLHFQGYPVPESINKNLRRVVPVQRFDNTNKFYLSESISRSDIPIFKEKYIEILSNAKEKNPTVDFVLDNIRYAEPNDKVLSEELKKSQETKFGDTEYIMDVKDDTFVHFAPKEVAQKIAKTKKLDPKFSETFADAVFAISLTYGEYVPSTQIHNIGGKRSENYDDYVGIVFKTNDIPKVGHIEEVSWEGPVNINILKFVTIKEAEKMLNNTPYNIDERDYVLYKNESEVNERQKAWIPGSKAVKVKQKCRLGGLNGTSVACNQGDISNLEFSSLDEETKLDQGFVNGWHRYDILHDDEVAGEMEVSNRDKFMVLNRIYINPEHRGMGHAKDAMKILTDYADANNKIIALTPDNTWGASKEKLRKWYSSLGFVMNRGQNADYRIQAAMIRRPQNSKIKESVDPKSVNTNEKSIKSVINGKRGVGFVSLVDNEWKEKVKNAGLKMLGPIHQKHHGGYENQMHVIFNPNIPDAENKARELFTIIHKNNGYADAKSPEGVRKIGKLLDYNKEAIDAFIEKRFGEKEISENIRNSENNSLDLLKESKYSKTKKSIESSKSIPKDKKEDILKYLGGGSSYKNGKVYGLKKPKIKGKSLDGVGFGADKNGFFVYTHRARSKSKESPDKIPQKSIDFIKSTG